MEVIPCDAVSNDFNRADFYDLIVSRTSCCFRIDDDDAMARSMVTITITPKAAARRLPFFLGKDRFSWLM
eukprot:CAMPEP_0201533558 /NCGR_PEP_ID=MMETSP0161_2-20130828/53573_1 /ASSEMBLY_ACC=CAM_ASM_000251 /TAXON_ID=180227 /ORGANISM="Neoparamoeba aestuarina, Strain SoJaBio B1-5/56/2" /LENGTH=69 /DNA_ID=CAMNT_0047937647 /DNA_START=416 /DNA_END=625 /DNA_ORIENTATION=-